MKAKQLRRYEIPLEILLRKIKTNVLGASKQLTNDNEILKEIIYFQENRKVFNKLQIK